MSPNQTPPQDEMLAPDDFFGSSEIIKIDPKAKPVNARQILDEILPQGENVKCADVVGQKIIIHYMKPFQGELGKALWVVATTPDNVVVNFVVGGQIIAPQLWMLRDRLPIETTIVENEGGAFGRYYTLE